MSSAIDASKPADGVPAVKEDLRDNLQAAKTELNHGGFAEGLAPSNYGPPASPRVIDHLAAIDSALVSSTGTFTGLTDTPETYAEHAGKFVRVNVAASGLEFVAGGSGATNADGVTYSPPWANGASRSVESRLADVRSVSDFHVVRDTAASVRTSEADNTAAFQAALDSFDDSGGVLLVPAGVYRFAGTIEWPLVASGTDLKPIVIVGESPKGQYYAAGEGSYAGGPTRLVYTGSGTFFEVGGASGGDRWRGGMMGLVLHGTGNGIGIHAFQMVGGFLDSMSINDFGVGLLVDQWCFYFDFRRVQFYSNTQYGARMRDDVNGVGFYSCKFNRNGVGLQVGDTKGSAPGPVALYSCVLESQDNEAVVVYNCFNLSLYSCYFEGNNEEGGNADIRFEPYDLRVDATSQLKLYNAYSRTADNKHFIDYKAAGTPGIEGTMYLDGLVMSRGAGIVTNTGQTGRLRLHSDFGRPSTTTDSYPLYSGSADELLSLTTRDCAFAEAFNGKRTQGF